MADATPPAAAATATPPAQPAAATAANKSPSAAGGKKAPPKGAKSPAKPGSKKTPPAAGGSTKATPTAEGAATADQPPAAAAAAAPADAAGKTPPATAGAADGKKTPGAAPKAPPGKAGGKVKTPIGKKSPASGAAGKKTPTPPAEGAATAAATTPGVGDGDSPVPPPPEEGDTAAAAGASAPAAAGSKKSPVPPGGTKVKSKVAGKFAGKVPPPGSKSPVGGTKVGAKPPGKFQKTPPAPAENSGKNSPQPPPAAGGADSPSPPPPPGADSPSPPPPPLPSDSPSPPPPPGPDSPDGTPRAMNDGAGPAAPAADDGKAGDPAATAVDPKKKKLTPAQQAAENERLRQEEEKRLKLEADIKDREAKTAAARALLNAPPPVFTVKLLIGAEQEILPNWGALKMMAEIPMTQPCWPYLEKVVLSKTGWDTLDGKTFYKASGNTPKNIRRLNEVFQVNLTPMQLGLEPGIHYIWLNRSLPDEEPVYTADGFFAARLERYYEFYDPDKRAQIPDVMTDFKGHEHLMMIKLRQKYGIEPSNEMILRKRAWIQRQKEIVEAAELQAARGSYNTNSVKTLAKRELRNLLGVMERDARLRVRFDMFQKWERFAFTRRMNSLIINFLLINVERSARATFYWKMKSHGRIMNYRKQLHVASQIAFKSESLLGELAKENTKVKEKITELLKQIDVLENANTKRLETLYASAETAVHELRTMAIELRAKEREVSALEAKLLHLGGRYVDAIEARQAALKQCAERQVEWERDEVNFQTRLKDMEEEYSNLQKQLEKLSIATGVNQTECPHCDHFFDEQEYAQSQMNNINRLRARLQEAEKGRSALTAELARLAREDASAYGRGGGGGEDDDGVVHSERATSPTGGAGADADRNKSPGGGEDERNASGSADNNATGNNNNTSNMLSPSSLGGLRSGSNNKPTTAQRIAMLRSNSGGYSRGMSSSASQQQQQQPAHRGKSGHSDPAVPTLVRESDLFRASSIDSSVLAQISKRSAVEKTNTSMANFFTGDALVAIDRVRISLDRQTAHRKLDEVSELIRRDPMAEAAKEMERQAHLHAARQAAIEALPPQQKARRDAAMQSMTDMLAEDEKYTRPPPQTNHGNYATLPVTSSSGRMLSTIFQK